MGRHTGFLTGVSALAHIYLDDGPYLIYFPERPFSMEKFSNDVENVYRKLGRCLVALSEDVNGSVIMMRQMINYEAISVPKIRKAR